MGNSDYRVIIPTYNECKNIEKVLLALGPGRCIVVDGHSDDGTHDKAEKLGAWVIKQNGRGYGDALKCGFDAADSDFVVFVDGDGTYDAASVPGSIETAKKLGLDAIFGDRLTVKGNTMKPQRYYANLLVTRFLNAIFWMGMKDSQSGYFVLKKEAANGQMAKSDGMPFSQELKIRLIKSGKKCAFIPIGYNDSRDGSKFNFFLDGAKLFFNAIWLRFVV